MLLNWPLGCVLKWLDKAFRASLTIVHLQNANSALGQSLSSQPAPWWSLDLAFPCLVEHCQAFLFHTLSALTSYLGTLLCSRMERGLQSSSLILILILLPSDRPSPRPCFWFGCLITEHWIQAGGGVDEIRSWSSDLASYHLLAV